MNVSFVIPLYNRPEEISELLASFQRVRSPKEPFSYEIIIVEDGSSVTSLSVIEPYQGLLPLHYFTQSNTGPSGARNHGALEAKGEWLMFLDSDTLLPEGYFEALMPVIRDTGTDLFGGSDKEHNDFTPIQKGISYSMTSFLTTGGIRGGGKKGNSVDVFYPRTFNMGIRRDLFNSLSGFDTSMRYGEDLDLSMRAIESGARSVLIPGAWLYHKRRTDYSAFFRQVAHSGEARWSLERKHPGTMKPVHALPALFSLGLVLVILVPIFSFPYVIYGLLILMDAIASYGYSFSEALHAVVASFVQHLGYGYGFIRGALGR